MDLVISENCYNFIMLIYRYLQTTIAMITGSKVIELYCMADDICKFFDAMMTKYTFNLLQSVNITVFQPCQRQKSCSS